MFREFLMTARRLYFSNLRPVSAIPLKLNKNFAQIRYIQLSHLLYKVKSKQGKNKETPTFSDLDIPLEIGDELGLSEFETEAAKTVEVLQHILERRLVTHVTAMHLDSVQVPSKDGFIPLKIISQLSFPTPQMVRLDMRLSKQHLHKTITTLKEFFPFVGIQTHGNDTVEIAALKMDKVLRQSMVKDANKHSQNLKSSLRNKGGPVLKKLKSNKSLSEDLVHSIENNVKSVLRFYAEKIDQITEEKLTEIESMN